MWAHHHPLPDLPSAESEAVDAAQVAEWRKHPDASAVPESMASFSLPFAHKVLTDLAAVGPSMMGTVANQRVGELLADQARRIAAEAAADGMVQSRVEVEFNTVSGSMTFDLLGIPMANVYDRVNNVVVRVSPANLSIAEVDALPGLLMNTHFDTPVGSPGVADDRSQVAIMLDVLRAVLYTPLRSDAVLVLLFNGCEEALQMCSHGFMMSRTTGDPAALGTRAARQVRAVLNLDSAGNSGPETLFQTAGSSLVRAYADVAPYPHGSAIAQDFFSLFVQGDTDFRIFVRDVDNPLQSGIDLALYRGDYVYHTALDTLDRFDPRVMVHTGRNTLAIVQRVMSGPEAGPDLLAEEQLVDNLLGHQVHFELFVNVAVVAVPLRILQAIAGAAVIAVIARHGFSLRGVGVTTVALVRTMAGPVVLGLVLSRLAPLSFFPYPTLAFCIYTAAALAALAVPPPASEVASFLAVATVALIAAGSGGVLFVFLFLLLAVLSGSPLVRGLASVPILLPFLGFIDLLVPMTGRMGAGVPGDVVVGGLAGFFTFLAFVLWQLPPTLAPRARPTLALLALTLALGAALFVTPFTRDTPKRIYLQHAELVLPGESAAADALTRARHPLLADGPQLFLMVADGHHASNAAIADIVLDRAGETLGHLDFADTHLPMGSLRAETSALFPFNHFLGGTRSAARSLDVGAFGLQSRAWRDEETPDRVWVEVEHGRAEFVVLTANHSRVADWSLDMPLTDPDDLGFLAIRHAAGRRSLAPGGHEAVLRMWFRLHDPTEPFILDISGLHFGTGRELSAVVESLPPWATPCAWSGVYQSLSV